MSDAPSVLSDISIRELYSWALAEEEGVGTAYEYYAKRLALGRWLRGRSRPQKILIAGLPQKYGLSLDFIQLAAEYGAVVTIIDERQDSLDELQDVIAAARIAPVQLRCLAVENLALHSRDQRR